MSANVRWGLADAYAGRLGHNDRSHGNLENFGKLESLGKDYAAGARARMWWVNVCKRSFAVTLEGTTRVSMLTHGRSERVARERAT